MGISGGCVLQHGENFRRVRGFVKDRSLMNWPKTRIGEAGGASSIAGSAPASA